MPLDHILVAITEEIDKHNPRLVAHGILGGEHGYGATWSSPVFDMRPFYWGDCDCGGLDRIDAWAEQHHHKPDCYQSELQKMEKEAGLPYWDDKSRQWIDNGKTYDQNKKIREHIYQTLMEKFNKPRIGCGVHCTCGRDDEFLEWVKDNGHRPTCSTELPNFFHKTSGLEVRWYKWIGRDMTTNGVSVDLVAVLKECLADIRSAVQTLEPK